MLTSTQDYSSILSEERNKVLDTLPSSKSTDNHAASLVKTRHGTFRQDPLSNIGSKVLERYEAKKRLKDHLSKLYSEITYNIQLFQVVLSVIAALEFIAASYLQMEIGYLTAILVIDLIFASLFLLFSFVNFFSAYNKWLFFIHPLTLLDYLTTIPPLGLIIAVLADDSWATDDIYMLIALFRVFRLFRVLPHINDVSNNPNTNPIVGKVSELLLSVASLVLIFSATFQWCENMFGTRLIYFHDSVYFMGITLFTIGYGDISPTSIPSKYVVLLFFALGIAIIPIRVSKVLNMVMSEKSTFKLNNLTLSNHYIVTGNARLNEIMDFLEDLFHNENRKNNTLEKVIILFQHEELCEQLRENVTKLDYRKNLYVYCGDIMSFEVMELLKVSKAKGAFLLNSPKFGNARKQDTSVIMASVALRNFNKNLDVYAQINYSDTKSFLEKAGISVVICNEALSTKMLSNASAVPGFGTFLSNLISSIDVSISNGWSVEKAISNSNEKWITEYFQSAGNEIYRVPFNGTFRGKQFQHAAAVFSKFEILTFAVEDKAGQILLNPSSYMIKTGDLCYCIARGSTHADIISSFELSARDIVKENVVATEEVLEIIEDDVDEQYEEMLLQEEIDFDSNEGASKKEKPKKKKKGYLKSNIAKDDHLHTGDQEKKERHAYLGKLLLKISPESYHYKQKKRLKKLAENEDLNAINQFYEEIAHNYNIESNARSEEEFLISSCEQMNDHIIITGEFQQPYIICSTIRSMSEQNYSRNLVFMTPHKDKYFKSIYERLKYFSRVYFLKGNPTKISDLKQANVHACNSVLYMTDEQLSNSSLDSETTDDKKLLIDETEYVVDADAIKLALNIQLFEPNVFFLTELSNRANIKFMQKSSELSTVYETAERMKEDGRIEHDLSSFENFFLLSDLFTSGKVFPSSSVLAKVVAQSYHNPKIVDLIDQMCAGEFLAGDNSVIFQVHIPEVLVGLLVGNIVSKLSRYGLLLLALNREKPVVHSKDVLLSFHNDYDHNPHSRYVFTNPPPSVPTLQSDYLLLCGKKTQYQRFLNTTTTKKAIAVRLSKTLTEEKIELSPKKPEDGHVVVNINQEAVQFTNLEKEDPIFSRNQSMVTNVVSSFHAEEDTEEEVFSRASIQSPNLQQL